jgi:hypothetical protein
MARQPAIELGVSLLMTIDTKSHLEIHLDQTIHLFYIPMALGTIDPLLDVPLMIELNVVGYIKDSNPGDRNLFFEMGPQLLDLWMLGNNVFVAEQAFPHCRNPCLSGSLHKGMTEPATDLLDSCVNPVAKIDRLFWTDGSMGINIKEIEHRHE